MPLPTYFMDDSTISPSLFHEEDSKNEEELNSLHCTSPKLLHSSSSNLYFLGNDYGMFTLSNGLTIAFAGPEFDEDEHFSPLSSFASNNGYRGCDLFLSWEWPSDIHQLLPPPQVAELGELGVGVSEGEEVVGRIASSLCPRYHLTSAQKEIFYTRPPYYCHLMGSKVRFTRFVSVGRVNSEPKVKSKKWVYALNLDPVITMSDQALEQPLEGATGCPYLLSSIPNNGNNMVNNIGPHQMVNFNQNISSSSILPQYRNQLQVF